MYPAGELAVLRQLLFLFPLKTEIVCTRLTAPAKRF